MQTLQELIVSQHIEDLRREAELLRTERRMRHRTRDGSGSGSGSGASIQAQSGRQPARVRLGHWLIGLGMAVSGSAREAH